MTTKDVLSIINSDKWQTKRKELLEQSGGKCQNCNSREQVEVFVDKVEALENPNNNVFNKTVLCHNCFLYFYVKTMAHHAMTVSSLLDAIEKMNMEVQSENINSLPEYCFDRK